MTQFFDIPDDNFFQYIKEYWKEEESRKMESTFVKTKSIIHSPSGYDSEVSDDTLSTISTSSED